MSIVSERKHLLSQLSETRYLLSLVSDDIIMSYGLKQKIQEIEDDLLLLPEELKEAKVTLLFSGGAVKGSEGIKTTFISKTLKPFQELVKTQSAMVRYGKVGKRGKQKSSSKSDLFLTALPRGSFGVELAQVEQDDFFAENEVATAINQVMDLVEAATTDDQTFEAMVEKTPLRNLNNLRNFLKNIDDENSILKMESGTHEISISKDQIHKGFERVNGAVKEDFEIFLNGTLKGALLESNRFEFIDEDNFRYSGLISPKVPEEKIQLYFNESCRVHLQKTKTRFASGKEKILFELLDVGEPDKSKPDDYKSLL